MIDISNKLVLENIIVKIIETKKLIINVLDKELNVYYLNDKYKYLNVSDKDIKNELLNANDIFNDKEINIYKDVLKSGKTIGDNIKKLKNNKGEYITYVSIISPIIIEEKIIGLIEIYEDYSSHTKLSEKIVTMHKNSHIESEIKSLKKKNLKNGTIYTLNSIITANKKMQLLKDKAKKIANSDSPVLIYGDTGTGKELFAQGIHNESDGGEKKPFIAQNCAAIPDNLLESILFGTTEGSFTGAKDKPGLFELAEGGTLFLDEINSMKFNLQAKLLRVIQENSFRRIGGKIQRKMNARVIVTFNEEPLQVIKRGQFRQDLYYRLNVIYFKIPKLSERKEDIKLLVDFFIDLYNAKFNKNVKGIDSKALKILNKQIWEGNIRELKNYIERVMNFTENKQINIDDISDLVVKQSIKEYNKSNTINEDYVYNNNEIKPLKKVMNETEKQLIIGALNASNGNVALAARSLDLPRQTLKNKIDKHKIKPSFR